MGPVADEDHRSVPRQSIALTVDTLGEPLGGNIAVLTDYLRCGTAWYLKQLRHMLAYRLEDRLPNVTRPVLVVRGGNDPIAGLEWCRLLRDSAGEGRFVYMPSHRHLVQWTAPRAVRAAIMEFVAKETSLHPQTLRRESNANPP
jgi:pimeloyl-ACP methyl ester carboxylesterase